MFNISHNAIEKIRQIKEINQNNLLRIAIDSGGCNGFKYLFSVDSQINQDDEVISNSGEMVVIIDKISLKFLENCTLEFVKELGASYFKIINPSATSTCGCGSSFATS